MKFKYLSYKAQLKACSDYVNELVSRSKDITDEDKRFMFLDAKQILLEDDSEYDSNGNLQEGEWDEI
jgi:hypothetical protein